MLLLLKDCRALQVLLGIIMFSPSMLQAQISGTVTDSLTCEPVPYIAVYYDGKGVGSITDSCGVYTVETREGWDELTFSAVGYEKKVVKVVPGVTKRLDVVLQPSDILLDEVVVKPTKEKYSRKDNPAVDFMREVIARKSFQELEAQDYYFYNKYQKITMSLNDVKPSMFEEGIYKRMSFLKDRLEVCEETNKMIIPVSVQETVSQKIFRKHPKSEKTIVTGMNASGVNDLLTTGDRLNTVLEEVFADVNIYDNDIRLLKSRFVSPISSTAAIFFYKYYIVDTVYVDHHECIHLTFLPQNSQDFGFTGHLYVLNDSTYAVKRCKMNLPKKTGVNFVENLSIIQEYEQLPSGNWVLAKDDMIAELYLVKALQGVQVRRTTVYSDYSFEELPAKLFKPRGEVIKEPDAMMKDDAFWAEVRQESLTKSESSMELFVERLKKIPGVNFIVFVAQALVENFIETGIGDRPSKIDIGPVNTILSHNAIDGWRVRASAQTTANLNPHWFFKGYYAYGFRDKKSKYMGEVEYSFDAKEYLPREFPKHSLSASYQYDVMSPMDKFLGTDKDNVFLALKATAANMMSYMRNIQLKYEWESTFGFSVSARLRHSNDEPAGALVYLKNDAAQTKLHDITTMEASVNLRYAPGETFVNTKQGRVPVSLDAPVFTLSHTTGFKALGGDYTFNLTEAGISKRFWLSSWGKVDVALKGGIQWNQVPFPLLVMPPANLSYILQDGTFNLLKNMEFLNDRYVSLDIGYDMNGKLFNRIPLIKKLKWREFFGFKLYYGQLTDKNNPLKNPGDGNLFVFPANADPADFVLDPKKPYMEFCVGIHNIFKLLHIEYVRRLNYLDHPGINKHGVRLMLRMTF